MAGRPLAGACVEITFAGLPEVGVLRMSRRHHVQVSEFSLCIPHHRQYHVLPPRGGTAVVVPPERKVGGVGAVAVDGAGAGGGTPPRSNLRPPGVAIGANSSSSISPSGLSP